GVGGVPWRVNDATAFVCRVGRERLLLRRESGTSRVSLFFLPLFFLTGQEVIEDCHPPLRAIRQGFPDPLVGDFFVDPMKVAVAAWNPSTASTDYLSGAEIPPSATASRRPASRTHRNSQGHSRTLSHIANTHERLPQASHYQAKYSRYG